MHSLCILDFFFLIQINNNNNKEKKHKKFSQKLLVNLPAVLQKEMTSYTLN